MPLRQTKVSKVKLFLEGSGHPNFMNPFEYGKSFLGKSFPKKIGTLTPPNPKIFRGGTILHILHILPMKINSIVPKKNLMTTASCIKVPQRPALSDVVSRSSWNVHIYLLFSRPTKEHKSRWTFRAHVAPSQSQSQRCTPIQRHWTPIQRKTCQSWPQALSASPWNPS